MKRRGLLVLLLGSISLILILAIPLTAVSAPTVLKAVAFKPLNSPSGVAFKAFVDRVNERGKGELKIRWLGGPEVIRTFDQAGAVRKGAVHMAWIFSAAYKGIAPGVEALQLTELKPLEEREGKAYDFIVELHKKAGLYYLGRGQPMYPHNFFVMATNKKVARPQDLAGQKMGTGTIAPNFMKQLGIAPVKTRELYTGTERGVIDGYAQPITPIYAMSLHEVTKYIIDRPFFTADIVTIMNLDAWNRLPKHLQDLLLDVQASHERDWPAEYSKMRARDWQAIMKTGKMEVIKFSPDDERWFFESAYEAEWNYLIKKYPELGPKLKAVLSK
jgi:TRAP-type C4-dicarboxylate transport system substrate-binding protein